MLGGLKTPQKLLPGARNRPLGPRNEVPEPSRTIPGTDFHDGWACLGPQRRGLSAALYVGPLWAPIKKNTYIYIYIYL